MKKEYIYLVLISLMFAAASYLSIGLWYFALGVGAIAFLAGLLFVLPAAKGYSAKCRLRHECYLFIHGFLVTLSVCMSMEKAFEVGTHSMGKEFHALDETLSQMDAREKVDYLVNYFQSDLYRMFLSILRLYLDRGGDVLKLSNELTAEASRLEETEQSYEKQAARKLVSFLFLWVMALVIVVFIRFGLSSFFEGMQHSIAYVGSLSFFYLFCILSIVVYVYAHTGAKIPLFAVRRKKT